VYQFHNIASKRNAISPSGKITGIVYFEIESNKIYFSALFLYLGLTLNQLEESAIGASVNFNDDFVDYNSNEDEEDLEDSALGGGRKDYPSDFRWPESYFDLEASSDVAVVVGQPAFLVCRVAVAGNWTVSPV